MLRYWKLIFITAIIVFSLGTYYVQNALAKSEYPEFILETISGDEAEVEDLTIDGGYGINGQNLSANLEISSEGSIYQGEMSYVNQLLGTYDNTIERLQSDYRNFMRGKGISTPTFFENGEILAYAGPFSLDEADNSFDIELLDKETNETTAFQVTIPNMEDYSFINIQDVQVSNNELIVISRNIKRGRPSESDSEEIHVYQIDITNQRIISDEVILSNNSSSSTEWIRMSEVNGNSHIGEENYFVFQLDYMKGDYYGSSVRDKTEYVAYHYETNELIELTMSEEIDVDNTLSKVYKDSIYFFNTAEENLQIIAFNIRNNEWNRIDLQTAEEVYPYNLAETKDDKMYITNFNDQQTNVYVLDLGTGKLLYEGKVEFENPEDKIADYYFNIYDMVIE